MLSKSDYNKLSKSGKAKIKKTIKGNGAYIYGKDQPYGHYGEKIGKYMAPFLGKYGPMARYVGAYAGHGIGKIMGSGGYRPGYKSKYRGAHNMFPKTKGNGAYDIPAQSNVLTNQNSPPSFGSNRTIVRHREFIQNVQSSTSFNVVRFDLNPGLETTFPWLSGIAANYEKYRPLGMIFEFKSTSANALNSANTALGTVMMATRYNAISQNVPQSKMEMLQIENCNSFCPAESAMCGVECARQYNPLDTLYVRLGTNFQIPNGAEQFYDFADFYIATEGMQMSGVNIGELWVTYEIELLTPVLNDGMVGNNINYCQLWSNTNIGTTSPNYILGLTPNTTLSSTMLLTTISTTNLTTVYFPPNISTGTYSIFYSCTGASTTSVYGPVINNTGTGYTNTVIKNVMENGNTGQVRTANVTAVFCCTQGYIDITGPNACFTLQLPGGQILPTSAFICQLIVQQIPDQD